jgi:hypothetical protein
VTKPAILQEYPDFSLVLGGPLYQLFRRAHLTGDALELMRRRVLVITGVAWLPLLLLSVLSGSTHNETAGIPFLYDIEAHVRLLIALPILIVAELVVHQRIRPVVAQFVERRLVVPEELPKFHQAIESTLRLRNSVIGEVALLVVVYTIGIWAWRYQVALERATWYANPDGVRMHPTAAGYWYFFVSLPVFQFVLVRWYLRFFFWFWFLWRVSRLNLRVIPFHPDKTGGLGFLGTSANAFAPILFAQGAVLAGGLASQIFYAGQNLMDFRVEMVSFVALFVVVIFIPLIVFTPHLVRARRQGMRDFGGLASRYTREFEDKWMHGGAAKDEAPHESLLGSADIQSLADLGGSYRFVQEMRFVPFGWKDMTRLAAVAATPLLPLSLTVFKLEELAGYAIKVLF